MNKFDYTKISDDCVKCGKCKPVCTIFNINQDEATSPRGFIDLLGAYKRDELELDENAKNIFESCFLCTNCVEVCPNDLPTDMIIEQVRSDIAKKFGIAWYKRLFFFLLRHRKIMDFMSKLGYMFQTCGIKINEEKQSATPRFSLPIVKKNRALPYADSISFLKKYPEIRLQLIVSNRRVDVINEGIDIALRVRSKLIKKIKKIELLYLLDV